MGDNSAGSMITVMKSFFKDKKIVSSTLKTRCDQCKFSSMRWHPCAVKIFYIWQKRIYIMSLYEIFRYLHSGFRFIVMLLLIVAALRALIGWLGNQTYSQGTRKLNLFAMISAHTQLLIGLVLYFVSPFVQFGSNTMKEASTRYWTVEHLVMMLFAIVLITIGHSRSKKATIPAAKHRAIAIFYLLAVIVIIGAIVASKRAFFGITGA